MTGRLAWNSGGAINRFDGNGNPTTYKSSALTFDAENRMTAYGSALTAGYRGDGLRAWKQGAAGATYFLYDGMKPVLEENSSGTVTAVNTFGPAGFLARTSPTRTLLYTSDLQGCACQQYDASSGALVASYLFDAYGNRSYSSGDQNAINEPFAGFDGVKGYYTDTESGLQLCGLRYYDQSAGRFLNRDPVAWKGGVNLYEYAGNSPLERADASGMGGPVDDPVAADPGGDGIAGCLAAVLGFASGILNDWLEHRGFPSIGTAICQLLIACAAGAFCGAVMSVGFGGGPGGCYSRVHLRRHV